jgi:hypothetical protein
MNYYDAPGAEGRTVTSRQSSPRSVHFDPFAVQRPEECPRGEIQTTVDRPRIPERSMSSTSIYDDSKKSSIDPKLSDCSDPNCAFEWTTYAIYYNCKLSKTTRSTPQEKVFIHDLLHKKESNPLLEPYASDVRRYVHLPANNMTWVEVHSTAMSDSLKPLTSFMKDLIKRYYYEHSTSKQLRLLRRDFWYGQEHGKSGPIHARFMRPRCEVVPGGTCPVVVRQFIA